MTIDASAVTGDPGPVLLLIALGWAVAACLTAVLLALLFRGAHLGAASYAGPPRRAAVPAGQSALPSPRTSPETALAAALD